MNSVVFDELCAYRIILGIIYPLEMLFRFRRVVLGTVIFRSITFRSYSGECLNV